MRVDKKGAIDLVTEIDLADRARVPRHDRRAISRSRRARRGVRRRGDRDATPRFCWVFDPVDGTTNYAHGLPIFCSSLALEIHGDTAVGAVYDPTRRELFTAERGAGCVAEWRAAACLGRRPLSTRCWCTGFPLRHPAATRRLVRPVPRIHRKSRAVRRLGSAALDLCYVAAGRFDGYWEPKIQPWDVAAGALIVGRGGRPGHDRRRRPVHVPRAAASSPPTATSTTRCSRSSAASTPRACSKTGRSDPRAVDELPQSTRDLRLKILYRAGIVRARLGFTSGPCTPRLSQTRRRT